MPVNIQHPLQTLITQADIEAGKWRVNPAVVDSLNLPHPKFQNPINTRG